MSAVIREYPKLRRNFTFGVLNGTFFMAALAFVAGSTVLPVFISRLTESRILIGLFSHMEWFGWLFPQLLAAIFIAHKRKVLSFYNGLSVARLVMFGLAIWFILIFKSNYSAMLIAFGTTFTIFSIFSGMAGVAFTEIVGKMIPLNKRGSFFGLRMFSGGLLAVLAGIAVKIIIDEYAFPFDFAYVCGISWVLMLLGLVCFALIKEPDVTESLDRANPKSQFKLALKIFKSDSNFRRLIFSKAWVNSALMATPFYVIFAMGVLGAPEWMAGIYLSIQMIGYLASNLLWGWLANYISNKKVIVLAGLCRVIPAIVAFLSAYFPVDPLYFGAVFLFIGMAESGIDMGYMTYLLEISPERGRILSIGIMQTLIAPTILFSGLGGWLSQLFSLKWLFAITFMTTSISLLISSKLHEPRVRSF